MSDDDTTSLLSTDRFPTPLLPATRLVGQTPFFDLSGYPGVTYSLYVPFQHYNPDPRGTGHFRPDDPAHDSPYSRPCLPLVVAVHGTSRDAEAARNALIPLADSSRAAIVAPLFAAGIDGSNDYDSYKILRSPVGKTGVLNADSALFEILIAVGQRWPGIDTKHIFLAGFSGGASFAIRFALAWPRVVSGVSIAAPTGSSLISPEEREKKWPDGLADVTSIFGKDAFRLENVKDILAWQLVVGSKDNALEGSLEVIAHAVERERNSAQLENREQDWDKVIRHLGSNRQERLKDISRGLQDLDVRTTVEVVQDAGHSRAELQLSIDQFLQTTLKKYWQLK